AMVKPTKLLFILLLLLSAPRPFGGGRRYLICLVLGMALAEEIGARTAHQGVIPIPRRRKSGRPVLSPAGRRRIVPLAPPTRVGGPPDPCRRGACTGGKGGSAADRAKAPRPCHWSVARRSTQIELRALRGEGGFEPPRASSAQPV